MHPSESPPPAPSGIPGFVEALNEETNRWEIQQVLFHDPGDEDDGLLRHPSGSRVSAPECADDDCDVILVMDDDRNREQQGPPPPEQKAPQTVHPQDDQRRQGKIIDGRKLMEKRDRRRRLSNGR